jgi:hypothetical protein
VATLPFCCTSQELPAVDTDAVSRLLRPGTTRQPGYPFPPYLEADRSCPLDPPLAQQFEPQLGGLPALRKNAAASTCGVCVNLARGDSAYLPEPDFLLRSATGSDVKFQRCFRTDQARAGYGSPGLSPGWVHNYDIVIMNSQPAYGAIPWQPMNVVYPNGEHDLLRPELTSDGQPTGRLLTTDRMPFTATGKPGDAPGHWQSITLKWRDDTTWVFAPYSSNSYLLDRLDTLTLDWDDNRRLLSVTDYVTHDRMLTLRYDVHGNLASIMDRQSRFRRYRFDVPHKSSKRPLNLIAVTQPTPAGVVQDARCSEYTYSTESKFELLWRIRQFDADDHSERNCYISYHDDHVVSIRDVIGLDHDFTYTVGTTRVMLQDQDHRVIDSWIQHLDERGRNIGSTDAQGRSTAINYD